MRFLVLVPLVLAAVAGTADAQRLPVPSGLSAGRTHELLATPFHLHPAEFPVQPTHWKRGALIGGLGTGALFVILVEGGGCDCLVDALAFTPLLMIPGAFKGAMVGGLFPKGEAPPQGTRVPASGEPPAAFAHATQARGTMNLDFRSATVRRSGNWKGAILLGVIAGTAFGLSVAMQAGDEGSERPFSDRLSDGLVAGALIAVPVTVIFAMLAGEES